MIVASHRTVWKMRKNLDGHFPCPGPLDSMRYAATEAAEAIDALLRQERSGDLRNNNRSSTVESELADCAMMLLTAMPTLPRGHLPGPIVTTVEAVNYLVAGALLALSSDPGGTGVVRWQLLAMDALHAIGQMIDMEAWVLAKRWKFEGKYMPQLRSED